MDGVMMLSVDQLKAAVIYDPEDGSFVRADGVRKGMVAGRALPSGYRVIQIKKRQYYEHRLAWLWMTGEWPKNQVDHIDGDKPNNKWANLRAATCAQNNWNKGKTKRSSTGLKGVTYHQRDRKWQAMIMASRNAVYLGQFDCPAAASFAYQIAADKAHKQFSRGL